MNVSQFKGVYFDKRALTKPWQSYIEVAGIRNFLGYFATEDAAALAYDAAARVAHGEFAVLNFPRPAKSPRLLRAAAYKHLRERVAK